MFDLLSVCSCLHWMFALICLLEISQMLPYSVDSHSWFGDSYGFSFIFVAFSQVLVLRGWRFGKF